MFVRYSVFLTHTQILTNMHNYIMLVSSVNGKKIMRYCVCHNSYLYDHNSKSFDDNAPKDKMMTGLKMEIDLYAGYIKNKRLYLTILIPMIETSEVDGNIGVHGAKRRNCSSN